MVDTLLIVPSPKMKHLMLKPRRKARRSPARSGMLIATTAIRGAILKPSAGPREEVMRVEDLNGEARRTRRRRSQM